MRKTRRTGIDKLHTLLFGQDLRITEGEPYCQVRPFDFAVNFEPRHLTKPLPVPAGEVIDIRTFGADPAAEDNAVAVQQAGGCGGESEAALCWWTGVAIPCLRWSCAAG